jgi:hypothetical protein
MPDRYLQFGNLKPLERIHARCSGCGMRFEGAYWCDGRTGESLHRIRTEFEAHTCEERQLEGATT